MMCGRKSINIVLLLCLAFSFILALGAVVLFSFMGRIVHNEIAKNVQLKEGTPAFDNWVEPPVPVYMKFYLFHVKNPVGVQKRKERPELEQRGPYTYLEVQNKTDIKFHDNGTLSYSEKKSYIFLPNMSNGSETDSICNVNLFLITASRILKYNQIKFKSLVAKLLSILEHSSMFADHTVAEWIWGYNDELLKLVKDVLRLFNYHSLKLPDKVGLYYNKNGTSDGVYTIYSGSAGYSNYTVIDKWNGTSILPYWTTVESNMINGTDGTSFPPFVTRDSKLYVFSSDLCRSIFVQYNRTVDLHGISLYRFVVPDIVFANVSVNPDNSGFCVGHCLGAGVLNVSTCQNGLPVIMSQPHFFMAARKYQAAIQGLTPSAKLSQTYLDIEPHTGMVLRAAKKLQVNINVERVSQISSLASIPTSVFLPIVWVNENAAADEAAAAKFKNQVLSLINMAFLLKVLLLVFTLVFFVVMCIVTIFCVLRSRKNLASDLNVLINEDKEGERV